MTTTDKTETLPNGTRVTFLAHGTLLEGTITEVAIVTEATQFYRVDYKGTTFRLFRSDVFVLPAERPDLIARLKSDQWWLGFQLERQEAALAVDASGDPEEEQKRAEAALALQSANEAAL